MKTNIIVFPERTDFLAEIVSQFVQRRVELDLTQADVDYIIGNPGPYVSKWECCMLTPTSFHLFCWAQALGCELRLEDKHGD